MAGLERTTAVGIAHGPTTFSSRVFREILAIAFAAFGPYAAMCVTVSQTAILVEADLVFLFHKAGDFGSAKEPKRTHWLQGDNPSRTWSVIMCAASGDVGVNCLAPLLDLDLPVDLVFYTEWEGCKKAC